MIDDVFLSLYEAACSAGDSPERASLLVTLAKQYDLANPEYQKYVDTIASWANSNIPDVRREVVFALFGFRKVTTHLSILADAWRQAPPDDLHWYASAIKNTIQRPDLVAPDLIRAVAHDLFLPDEGYSEMTYEQFERRTDNALRRAEAWRAVRHLAEVIATPGQLQEFSSLATDGEWHKASAVMWFALLHAAPKTASG